MSCYFRHLNQVFREAGITVTPANKKEIDRAFHQIAGVPYKECPETWKRLKAELAGGAEAQHELARKLQTARTTPK